MNDKNIIFPIGPGRCGTSLVTGLFAQMGVWVGTARQKGAPYNPKGFFENVYFKQFIRQAVIDTGVPPTTVNGWNERVVEYNNPNFRQQLFGSVMRDGYKGGPIALKNPLTSNVLDILKSEFPNAIFLHVDREHEETITSFAKKPSHVNVPRELIAEWVTEANTQCRKYSTHTVRTETIIAGNTKVLEDIVAGLGLYWDHGKAIEFIEPTYWHGKVNKVGT